MPNSKQAAKRVKTDAEKKLRNRAVKSRLRTLTRQLDEAVTAGNADDISAKQKSLIAALDKAVSKGVLHKNTVSRRKSRLAKKLAPSK